MRVTYPIKKNGQFDSTSMDALLVMYICIYELSFLYCFCFCKTRVCLPLVNEIKNIIITVTRLISYVRQVAREMLKPEGPGER